MVFNSVAFAVFALVVFPVYALLRGRPLRIWLVAMSYVFYGWANPWYVFLLLASTVVDFIVGRKLYETQSAATRKKLLALSITANLGLLGVFKYSGFFVGTLNDVLALAGIHSSLTPPNILLPIGISFYTFQTLSYTIDIYRGKLEPARSFSTFALYVSFFPQLVAGPIERATHLLHQLERKQRYCDDNVLSGTTRIMWGLAKKVVFADHLGVYVAQVYQSAGTATQLEVVLATYAFAFQIYLDFSAYSDIAIGLARVMGVHLRENFRWPYLARNISEFWQRWHISLSTWLRDYLYIPLGGSRKGAPRTVLNVLIVMFLGGLWHGADVKFIVWGLWLGLALGIYHTYATITRRTFSLDQPRKWRDLPGMVLTFHTVLFSWVFFRAASTSEALTLLGGLVSGERNGWAQLRVLSGEEAMITSAVLAIVFLAHIVRGLQFDRRLQAVRQPIVIGVLWGVLIIVIALFQAPTGARFIYFRF